MYVCEPIKCRNCGFSLLEFSLIIILVSLLIISISSAITFIKRAELNSIIRDVESYKNAVSAFETTYQQLPGDFNNAFAIWGTSCASSSANCNGNNNNVIEKSTGPNGVEIYLAWRHLNLSQILPGIYTGIGYGSGNQGNIGQNIPASSIEKAGFSFINKNYPQDFGYTGLDNIQHTYLVFAAAKVNSPIDTSIINPSDAQSIDIKIDDGKPGSGKVIAGYLSTNCVTSSPYLTSEYVVSDETKRCILFFKIR